MNDAREDDTQYVDNDQCHHQVGEHLVDLFPEILASPGAVSAPLALVLVRMRRGDERKMVDGAVGERSAP